MRRSGRVVFAVAIVLVVASSGVGAQGASAGQAAGAAKAVQAKGQVKGQAKGQVKGQVTGQVKGQAKDASAASIFRAGDREAFTQYFAGHNMRAKPLPPGMAKRLAKGKPLPPGIAKQVMPADLLKIAPPLPKDAEYGIVGDAVVVSKAGVVLDILAGVLK